MCSTAVRLGVCLSNLITLQITAATLFYAYPYLALDGIEDVWMFTKYILVSRVFRVSASQGVFARGARLLISDNLVRKSKMVTAR